jgi:hypothetical protein
MSADKSKKASSPAVPLPVQGAHHGPGDKPGVNETVSEFVEKAKKSGVLSYKVLGGIVLILVAVIVYRFIDASRGSAQSREWLALEQASTVAKLEDVSKHDTANYPAKVAEVDLARERLVSGIATLQQSDPIKPVDPAKRKAAIEDIEKARTDFLKLADVFAKDVMQQPLCYWGAAKAEEALIGVPKDGPGLEHRGLASKAAEYYQKAAAAAGSSPLAERAKAMATELTKNANDITMLQSDVYKPVGPNPPFGGFPGGGFPGMPGGPSIPGLPGGPAPKIEPSPAPAPPAPPKEEPKSPEPAPKTEPAPAPKTEPTPAPKIEAPPVPPTPPAPPAPPKTESPSAPTPPKAPEPTPPTPPKS